MRFSLALLLLAAVYIAVDAQYYIASYDNSASYEEDLSGEVSPAVSYIPVTLVSDYGSSELGRSSIYLTDYDEVYEGRQGLGGGSGGGGGGYGGGKKKRGGKGKKKKGKKKKGKKKGGFWYYWGPVVKHVKKGWGWGHGGGGGGGGGGGYGGGGGGLGGGGGGYGGGGGGYGGGGGGGGGGGHGWGWKKQKIYHVHYKQPHFPEGKPLHVIKHPQKHIHHHSHGWGH